MRKYNKMNIDFTSIINHYYNGSDKLRDILVTHSRAVADYALQCSQAHPEYGIDNSMLEAAAMLHDIGIIRCDAPGIECYGNEPYICHGVIGATMLRTDAHLFGMTPEEIEPFARVCERHTGTGLTLKQIELQQLPLPHQDFTPETITEQLICYADKFFSKSHPERMKSYDKAQKSIGKFGTECIDKLKLWHDFFG